MSEENYGTAWCCGCKSYFNAKSHKPGDLCPSCTRATERTEAMRRIKAAMDKHVVFYEVKPETEKERKLRIRKEERLIALAYGISVDMLRTNIQAQPGGKDG